MNKELTHAATLTLGVHSYKSPTVHVVDITSEGVLCQSTKGNEFEGWGEEDLWS